MFADEARFGRMNRLAGGILDVACGPEGSTIGWRRFMPQNTASNVAGKNPVWSRRSLL
jgi:hypothetical protein